MEKIVDTYGVWIIIIGIMFICLIYFGVLAILFWLTKQKRSESVIKSQIDELLAKYEQPDVDSLKKFLSIEIVCLDQLAVLNNIMFERRKAEYDELCEDYDWIILNTDTSDQTVIF